MDPLSDVLSLLKMHSYACGGFDVGGDLCLQFAKHAGIKCYAVVAGEGWLLIDGVVDPVQLKSGDCFTPPPNFQRKAGHRPRALEWAPKSEFP